MTREIVYTASMPRAGKRIRVSKGIYRNGNPGSSYEVRATVGGHTYSALMPGDSKFEELKQKRDELRHHGHTETPLAKRGTLRADAPRYLALVTHLASADDRADHLDAWIELVGDVYRHRITSRDVLTARGRWLTQGRPPRLRPGKRRRVHTGPLSPKTINHYCGTLRHLYRTLDGPKARTPVDDVAPLPVPKTPIQRIPEALMIAIDQRLQERETAGILPDAKTRARFRVLVSTGKRPCEVMRAVAGDVNLDARVWIPRDAKGGYSPGTYLNEDQLAAWKLFIQADAWGGFSHGSFVKSLRAAGWPVGVRLYQARHSTWIAASERGADLADIAAGAGHTDMRLTRRTYVPILNSRMQQLGEKLDGRFGGWIVPPVSGPDDKSQSDK